MYRLGITLFFIILTLITIKDVYAYIDPGSGSYFLQILAAGIFSAIFVIKKFWKKITLWILMIYS